MKDAGMSEQTFFFHLRNSAFAFAAFHEKICGAPTREILQRGLQFAASCNSLYPVSQTLRIESLF